MLLEEEMWPKGQRKLFHRAWIDQFPRRNRPCAQLEYPLPERAVKSRTVGSQATVKILQIASRTCLLQSPLWPTFGVSFLNVLLEAVGMLPGSSRRRWPT